MRNRTAVALAAAGLLLAPATALAANPHYVVGPDFTLVGSTVTATGSAAGLGNDDVDVVLEVEGFQEVQCRNKGGNIAPGQTKLLSDQVVQEDVRVENGRVDFSISATLFAGEDFSDSCPNPSWTPLPGPVVVTDATLTILQPAGSGTVVLQDSATF